MKTCSTCKESKAFAAFHRDSSKHDGYRAECAACKQAKQREKYRADEAHRERIKAATRRSVPRPGTPERQAWLDSTREQRKAYKAARRRKAGSLTIQQIAERKATREAQESGRRAMKLHSAHVAAWKQAKPGAEWAHRYRNDAEFNAREKVRARLRKTVADADLWRHLASELKAARFNAKWSALLGYTMSELVSHLQRTLPDGAKWEQFLDGELHIDHITPRAAFDLTDIDEVRACWSLGNLRLLRARDNLAKADRIEVLL